MKTKWAGFAAAVVIAIAASFVRHLTGFATAERSTSPSARPN